MRVDIKTSPEQFTSSKCECPTSFMIGNCSKEGHTANLFPCESVTWNFFLWSYFISQSHTPSWVNGLLLYSAFIQSAVHLYSAFIQSAVHLYSAFIQSAVHLYSAFVQSTVHLYSAFIQSAVQFMPLIHPFTHTFTHQRRLAAMQGTNQLVGGWVGG